MLTGKVRAYLTFQRRLLALPSNIRLGWKALPGTNALAYFYTTVK
jgi:hypothetical protein